MYVPNPTRRTGFTYYPEQSCGYLKSVNGPLYSCDDVGRPCQPADHYSRAAPRRRLRVRLSSFLG
jgi:hypothetical protein